MVESGHWWVGCVLRVEEEETGKILVTLLNPHGPSHAFSYPLTQHVLSVPQKKKNSNKS